MATNLKQREEKIILLYSKTTKSVQRGPFLTQHEQKSTRAAKIKETKMETEHSIRFKDSQKALGLTFCNRTKKNMRRKTVPTGAAIVYS